MVLLFYLEVNNDTWDKYLKEQRHKELEEKDREFNENLIYHMVEEEYNEQ